MKFTDGYWQMREGYLPYLAVQVHEVEVEPATPGSTGALIVYAATKHLAHRADTLNLPLLTIRLSSPMRNIVRIQVMHHKGSIKNKPSFDLCTSSEEIQIYNEAQHATLSGGELAVRVSKGPNWMMEFLGGGKTITHSGWRALGYVDTPEGRFMHEQLSLAVGECVYGLGEHFTAFVKNGQVIEMWNEDGGTASEIAYKNVPFYLTNRGYGVFVNHPEKVAYEVASEKVERIHFSVPGEYLEYYVIYGPSPKEVLERYTALTGRPALPPAWSFGLWLTTSFVTNYDEKTVTGFIQGMTDRHLPLHVFHFDCFWMKEFHWVNLEWDQRLFPDPAGMLKRLKERGLHICVWINPYIAQRSALFDEGMQHGYLLKRLTGEVFQWDKWQAGMAIVDFTNPAACQWYADKLRALVDLGVDCFKTDFGERIPTEVVYSDGSDPVKMHNYYSYLYNQVVFNVLEEKLGIGQATVFARSATTGGQKYPVHWGGDSTATFESMAESLRGGLSLCLSGFGFWSHDMGGFEQTASADVYKRWCAFGLLSSHSRLHGNSSYRVPWLFDEDTSSITATDVLRRFTNLKCQLMPYLFEAAIQAHTSGVPMLRAMLLEFPEDPGCDYLDRQYMLGESLLVAPVFRSDGVVDYYLPAGRWTNFLTNQVVEGGRWLRETHDYLHLPLMVRPNRILPIGNNDQRPDYPYADGVTFHIFELQAGQPVTVNVPDLAGNYAAACNATRNGRNILIEVTGASQSWQVLMRNIYQVAALEGGLAQVDDLGTRIIPDAGSRQVKFTLP